MPDHIVIVIEENKSFQQIIGNPSAPYINALAEGGASLTNFYAITHPSQPNYIQFFSGSNQGVTSNSTPGGVPFSTPNLGAELIAAGHTFTGYSQSMPSVGFTGDSFTTVPGQSQYERKHNPWVNWQAASPTGNRLPAAVNRPFTDFPTDFSNLPRVSIVVPDEQNDMHDGTIAQADAWLQNKLGAYADWAQTNNSLLIVTWDEDSFASRNQIPTIFFGPMVRQTTNNSTWTLHNLARTVGDMFGAAPPGSAAAVSPITGVFTSDSATTIHSFRQGVNGYSGARDTYIESAAPDTAHAAGTVIGVDGSPLAQGLIRFDDIIGNVSGQVPRDSQVLSAKLVLLTGNITNDNSVATMSLHPMLTQAAWNDGSTWNSLGDGVSADGSEAAAASEFAVLPNQRNVFAIFDVTKSLQEWVLDPTKNNGWLLQPSGTDGWNFDSSEFATLNLRPLLQVTLRDLFPGDANGDDVVDFTDLGIVLNNYNLPGTFSTGDFDRSGTVDFTDLGILLNNYNQHAPVAAPAAPVPEPTTFALAACAVLGLLFAGRRQR